MALRDDHFARTRAALLSAAGARFGRYGYDATSLAEIAGDVGATTGALYHHFANKQAVFAQVAEEAERGVLERVTAALDPSLAGVPLILAAVDNSIKIMSEPHFAQILLIDAPKVLGFEAWRALEMRYGLGVLMAMFSSVAPAQNPELRARLLLALILEASLLVSGAVDPGLVRDETLRIISAFLNSLATNPAQ